MANPGAEQGKVAPGIRGTAWRLGMGVAALVLASAGGRAQGTPTISIGDVSIAEGNSGISVATATVTLANPNAMETRVRFSTANVTASGNVTTRSFSATGGAIPDAGPPLPFTLDTSTLTETALTGSVVFQGLTHPNPDHLDALLVAPNGEKMVVLSDVAGPPASGTTFTLREYERLVTNLVSGVFNPTSLLPADTFGAPAPAGPYTEAPPVGTARIDDLVRGHAPGNWQLFVADDTAGGLGSLAAATLVVEVPQAGSDFGRLSGEITFGSGELSKPIRLVILGDTTVEPHETFQINLSSPVNGVIVDDRAVVTILNDDGGGGGPPPTAVDDRYVPCSGERVIIRGAVNGVLSNDLANGGGPMTVELVTGPASGSLTLHPDGSFTYVAPSTLFSERFTYRARNLNGTSNVASVFLDAQDIDTLRNLRAKIIDRTPRIVGGIPVLPERFIRVRFDAPSQGTPEQYAITGGVLPGQTLAQIPTGSAYPIFEFAAPPAGSYYIRAHAVTGNVLGAPSNEVPLHVNTTVTPSAPTNLLGLVDGSNVALAWQNTYGGGIPTDSFLRVSGAASLAVPLGSTDTFAFSGVPPGTYTIDVVNSNTGGISPPSNPVTLTFPGPCSGPPEMPEDFLLYVRDRILGAIWELPAGGPAPTSYVLHVESAVFTGSVPLNETNIEAAAPPGTYTVSVGATTCGGPGVLTPTQTVVVP